MPRRKKRKTVSPGINGRSHLVTLRVPHATMQKIETAGETLGLDRSGVIKAVLSLYLDERATNTEAKIKAKMAFDAKQVDLFQ